MKTIQLELFTFEELSEEAQERALNDYKNGEQDDFWEDERNASYEASKDVFDRLHSIEGEIYGGRLVAWIENNLSSIWRNPNYISKHKNGTFKNSYFEYKHECLKYRRSRIFSTNNLENCPLTGVIYDSDFLNDIIDFMANPLASVCNTDLKVGDIDKIAQDDYEHRNSDDFIKDYFTSNEVEFTANGKQY